EDDGTECAEDHEPQQWVEDSPEQQEEEAESQGQTGVGDQLGDVTALSAVIVLGLSRLFPVEFLLGDEEVQGEVDGHTDTADGQSHEGESDDDGVDPEVAREPGGGPAEESGLDRPVEPCGLHGCVHHCPITASWCVRRRAGLTDSSVCHSRMPLAWVWGIGEVALAGPWPRSGCVQGRPGW